MNWTLIIIVVIFAFLACIVTSSFLKNKKGVFLFIISISLMFFLGLLASEQKDKKIVWDHIPKMNISIEGQSCFTIERKIKIVDSEIKEMEYLSQTAKNCYE